MAVLDAPSWPLAVGLARRPRDGCGTTWRSRHARRRRGCCSGGRERPADRGGIGLLLTP